MKSYLEEGMCCDAVILAGGGPTPLDPTVPNKNFLLVRGRPLWLHEVEELCQVSRIDRIFVVGPRAEIESWLSRAEVNLPDGKVIPWQEEGNIVENVWYPFISTVEGFKDGDPDPTDERADKVVFAAGGDSPLLTRWEVDQFLDGCHPLDKIDYFMGFTSIKDLGFYEPHGGFPGITMAYSHFAEGLLRINNLHLFKPFRIRHKMAFADFYRIRRLSDYRNIVKSGLGLLRRKQVDWDVLSGWFTMLVAMKFRQYGFSGLSDWFRRFTPESRGERVVGKLLGTRCRIVKTVFGGSALDIDQSGNREVIEEMFDHWYAYQKNQAMEPKPGYR